MPFSKIKIKTIVFFQDEVELPTMDEMPNGVRYHGLPSIFRGLLSKNVIEF